MSVVAKMVYCTVPTAPPTDAVDDETPRPLSCLLFPGFRSDSNVHCVQCGLETPTVIVELPQTVNNFFVINISRTTERLTIDAAGKQQYQAQFNPVNITLEKALSIQLYNGVVPSETVELQLVRKELARKSLRERLKLIRIESNSNSSERESNSNRIWSFHRLPTAR